MDLQGKQTLIAFCTAAETDKQDQWQSSVGTVVEKLRTLLPLYMIPAIFVPLDTLPTTITGKRDWKQLRHIATEGMTAEEIHNYRRSHSSQMNQNQHSSNQGGISAPSLELVLASIWAEALGLEKEVEITFMSNFFELGGDSVGCSHVSCCPLL